jgi:c-di-GMP-binding flagellar brake protein YcgR
MRVKLRRLEEPEDEAFVVRTFELSEGGMSVYASETLEPGTPLLVYLALSHGAEAMKIRAVVRNRRGFRCGVEFVELAMAERQEIVRYLNALADVIEI